jgi:hypothetical protein
LKGFTSRNDLSVSCHFSASAEDRLAILGRTSLMLASEVRQVAEREASVAGSRARR